MAEDRAISEAWRISRDQSIRQSRRLAAARAKREQDRVRRSAAGKLGLAATRRRAKHVEVAQRAWRTQIRERTPRRDEVLLTHVEGFIGGLEQDGYELPGTAHQAIEAILVEGRGRHDAISILCACVIDLFTARNGSDQDAALLSLEELDQRRSSRPWKDSFDAALPTLAVTSLGRPPEEFYASPDFVREQHAAEYEPVLTIVRAARGSGSPSSFDLLDWTSGVAAEMAKRLTIVGFFRGYWTVDWAQDHGQPGRPPAGGLKSQVNRSRLIELCQRALFKDPDEPDWRYLRSAEDTARWLLAMKNARGISVEAYRDIIDGG
jgi:hypothetical protein